MGGAAHRARCFSLDAVARARRRCLRALLAFFAGGVIRQLRQRLPRPRRHDPHVITGCTCAQRTRHDERDAPPTRRGKDLHVCAPGSSGGVRRTLCWGRARAWSRRPGAGHRPRTAGAEIGGGRGSPSRWRPCLTASDSLRGGRSEGLTSTTRTLCILDTFRKKRNKTYSWPLNI